MPGCSMLEWCIHLLIRIAQAYQWQLWHNAWLLNARVVYSFANQDSPGLSVAVLWHNAWLLNARVVYSFWEILYTSLCISSCHSNIGCQLLWFDTFEVLRCSNWHLVKSQSSKNPCIRAWHLGYMSEKDHHDKCLFTLIKQHFFMTHDMQMVSQICRNHVFIVKN